MKDELIALLEENARLSPEEIATMLDRPVAEIRAAIEALERDGVIVKYKAVVNDEKRAMDVVTALIEVKVSPERESGFDAVAERIYRFPEVDSCYLLSGDYDLLVLVEGRTLREVADFVATKLSTIDRVAATRTHFLLKKYKEDGDILRPGGGAQERLPVAY